MSNRSEGNKFERELADILFRNGCWVHLLQQNSAGQPADIIATKNGNCWLIDCKVCSVSKFALSRVEPNQELAMLVWRQRNGTNGWFALKFGDKVYMLSHGIMTKVRKSYLTEAEVEECSMKLGDWMVSAGIV